MYIPTHLIHYDIDVFTPQQQNSFGRYLCSYSSEYLKGNSFKLCFQVFLHMYVVSFQVNISVGVACISLFRKTKRAMALIFAM